MNQPFEQSDSGIQGGSASSALASPIVTPFAWRSRIADYGELAKLRISSLVLAVTAAGFCLGSHGSVDVALLFRALLGIALVAIAANTLNQVMESPFDRLMRRTQDRPIPSGRMNPQHAAIFGATAVIVGSVELAVFVNLLAASLALLTFVLYLAAYTPAKRRTVHNTLIGAIPGALPPVIGYAAARGRIDAIAWMLFAIVFVWQLPHFFAIAWMYREDYTRAGYRMLSVIDPTGGATGRQTVFYSTVLIAVSVLPTVGGHAGMLYLSGALLFGAAMWLVGLRLAAMRNEASARLMLLTSIVYLPALMILLLIDRVAG